MNIHELDEFRLEDTVKFHDRLNPRLWGRDEHLLPQVRDKLLEIAADFQEFLGVGDLDIEDITISGSNAAYSYSPNSDIDLHLVVRMPEGANEVYQELFNAKKYQYNDQHDIKIGGADVELYVQPSNEPAVSQGIYSVRDNKWIAVPRRKKAQIDDACVRHKVEDLGARIADAIASGDEQRMITLKEKIKRFRQAGLDQHGEFGCDNLTFKVLRNQGDIKKLYDAINAAKDQRLSLAERNRPRQRVRYGFSEGHYGSSLSSEDGVAPSTQLFLNETDQDQALLDEFIKFAAQGLRIENMPKIHLHRNDDWAVQEKSFGRYDPETHELHVNLAGRHIMDIMRTTAHELTHCREHEMFDMPPDAGDTGSVWENYAHAAAGIIMRDWAAVHPELFDVSVTESVQVIEGQLTRRLAAAAIALAVNVAQAQSTEPVQQPSVAGVLNTALKLYGISKIRSPQVQGEINQEVKNYLRAVQGDANAQNQSWTWRMQNQPQPEQPVNEASGYIPTKKQARDPRFSMALTVDVHPGQTGKEANKMALKTDAQGRPALLMKTANLRESAQLDQPEMTVAQLAKKHDVSVADIQQQLDKGIGVEMEHTSSRATAKEIALDHLAEFPDYYDRLERVEAKESLVRELSQEFALLEDEFLGEIKMSPTNLRAEAAKTGAVAGMEFEMIVPNVNVDSEPEYERDESYDRRARSFDDIEEFFYDGDYNGRGDVRRLAEALREDYMNWKMERTADDWADNGMEFLRDWVADNDLFDREEALDQARDDITDANPDLPTDSEDFQQLVNARINELEEQFVESEYEAQGRIYNDAFDTFADMKNEEYDESDFLEETVPYMTDVVSNYDIQWPYYYNANEGDGDMGIETVADDFSSAVGMKVNWSSSYHGGRREPDAYVVEPDGSLEANDSDDGGLEFVSPPMPIDRMIEQLNKVKAWAGDYGCYTNSSTGLHINISVPNYSLDKLDYVKLALLLGDEYVLKQFGRSSNTYTKSAMGKVRTMIQQKPENAKVLLDKMRGHMEDLATKAIHSGTTDKYTSINTKDGYIEFRSPGGDWLDANFGKIENTLLRFTVALSAAIDPEAYREEYLKKLYKLLDPEGGESRGPVGKGGKETIKYFADYVAGKMPKAALRSFVKQVQLQRQVAKGRQTGPMWWVVTNPANNAASIEVVANNKEEAIASAILPGNYPEWARVQDTLKATPVRPYEAPQAKPAASPEPQSGQYTYRVFTTDGNQTLGTFQSDGIQGSTAANIAFRNYLTTLGRDSAAGVNYEEIGRQRPAGGQSAVNTPPASGEGMSGNWGIWMINANRFARWPGEYPAGQEVPLRRFTTQQAAQSYLDDLRSSRPGLRSDLEIREIEPAAQPAQQPQAQQPAQSGGGFTGTWIIKSPDGQELHRFSGIGNSQADANNFAIRWLRSNPQHLRAGVEVVPEMT